MVSPANERTRQGLADPKTNANGVSRVTNVPDAHARWWIAHAIEIQYGPDAPVTEFARALWRQSAAAAQPIRQE